MLTSVYVMTAWARFIDTDGIYRALNKIVFTDFEVAKAAVEPWKKGLFLLRQMSALPIEPEINVSIEECELNETVASKGAS